MTDNYNHYSAILPLLNNSDVRGVWVEYEKKSNTFQCVGYKIAGRIRDYQIDKVEVVGVVNVKCPMSIHLMPEVVQLLSARHWVVANSSHKRAFAFLLHPDSVDLPEVEHAAVAYLS